MSGNSSAAAGGGGGGGRGHLGPTPSPQGFTTTAQAKKPCTFRACPGLAPKLMLRFSPPPNGTPFLTGSDAHGGTLRASDPLGAFLAPYGPRDTFWILDFEIQNEIQNPKPKTKSKIWLPGRSGYDHEGRLSLYRHPP